MSEKSSSLAEAKIRRPSRSSPLPGAPCSVEDQACSSLAYTWRLSGLSPSRGGSNDLHQKETLLGSPRVSSSQHPRGVLVPVLLPKLLMASP